MLQVHSHNASCVFLMAHRPIQSSAKQLRPSLGWYRALIIVDGTLDGRILVDIFGHKVDIMEGETLHFRCMTQNLGNAHISQPSSVEGFLVVLLHDPQGELGGYMLSFLTIMLFY